MEKCLQCQMEITQTPGRRKKQFCGETCRSNYWYAKNKKGKAAEPEAKKNNLKSVKTKVVAKVVLKDGRSGTVDLSTPIIPKSLEDIKRMCPIEAGIERTMWINDKRKELGI